MYVLCGEDQARLLRLKLRGARFLSNVGEIPPEGADGPVVVLRGKDVLPEDVAEAVMRTGASVPVLVAPGPSDELGCAFEEAARSAGVPEKCVLRGTLTVSGLIAALDGLSSEDLPDPPLFGGPREFGTDYVLVGGEDTGICSAKAPYSPPATATSRGNSGEVSWAFSGGLLIPVIGATGGVGRTVMAASLAAVIRRQGHGVLLLDAGHPPCAHRYIPDGEVVLRAGPDEAGLAEAVAWAKADVVLVDTVPSPPYLANLVDLAHRVVVVISPDPHSFEATKEFWPRVAAKAVLVVNRLSVGAKNLRGSFREIVIGEEMKDCLGIVDIPETEEVIQAFGRGVPPASFEIFGDAAGRILAHLGI